MDYTVFSHYEPNTDLGLYDVTNICRDSSDGATKLRTLEQPLLSPIALLSPPRVNCFFLGLLLTDLAAE